MLYNEQKLCYTRLMDKNITSIQMKNEDFYFLYVERRSDKGITDKERHNHSFYEIMFIAEGESEYVIENRRYILKAGDAMLVCPYLHHFEYNRLQSHSSLYCLGFSTDAISNGNLAEKIFSRGEHIALGENSPFAEMLSAAKSKLRLCRKNEAFFIKSLTEAIIYSLDDYSSDSENTSKIENRLIQKTIEYIDANIYQIKTLDDIAAPLFFSKSYVRSIFKKEMGIGIMEYVKNKKMARAHERIKKGEKPTEIFLEFGFSTYSGFYRAYLNYFGYSPKTKTLKIDKHKKSEP